jgi:hypothetical protein
MTTSNQFTPSFLQALGEPVAIEEVRCKTQAPSGNRTPAIAYIDARSVMDWIGEAGGKAKWISCLKLAG